MPDPILETSKNFLDADPILGSVIIVLMVVIGFLVRWVKSSLSEVAASKNAHLEDVRKFASENAIIRNVVDANTEQTRANTNTMQNLIEVFRERVRG